MAILLCVNAISFAQDKKAKVAAPAAKSAVVSGKTKADGTPDMRFKENKEKAAPVTGPTKKDGTPDMRYNANKPKEAPKKKG